METHKPNRVLIEDKSFGIGGGPLAFAREGDFIDLDVPVRRLHPNVSDEELRNQNRNGPRPIRLRQVNINPCAFNM